MGIERRWMAYQNNFTYPNLQKESPSMGIERAITKKCTLNFLNILQKESPSMGIER